MQRPFHRFVGVDLGGARGKTTVVAHLSTRGDGVVTVDRVATRAPGDGPAGAPWHDATLAAHLAALASEPAVIAIDAPLTQPACGRCVRPACPGVEACDEPATAWLRREAAAPDARARDAAARDARARDAAAPDARARDAGGHPAGRAVERPRPRLLPYAHRATEVVACLHRGLLPPTALGRGLGPIAARAGHLVRRLASAGLHLHERLLEVSSAATVAALRGGRAARGYKRDADPWRTRADILAALPDLAFAPHSRFAREDTLRNDHCFDAIVAGYTAFLWARDGWALPPGWDPLVSDGWIWTPPG